MTHNNIQGARDFVGTPEVLRILGVSRPTLLRYVEAGQFPKPLSLPGRARWLKSDIEAVLRRAGAL